MAKLDRLRVEEALPPHVRAALPEIVATWGVRIPERWPKHPALRKFLALTAAQNLQADFHWRGDSETAALRLACGWLGLNYETTRSGLGVWRATYRRANERKQRRGENHPHLTKAAG